jgi:hypothetical protein
VQTFSGPPRNIGGERGGERRDRGVVEEDIAPVRRGCLSRGVVQGDDSRVARSARQGWLPGSAQGSLARMGDVQHRPGRGADAGSGKRTRGLVGK